MSDDTDYSGCAEYDPSVEEVDDTAAPTGIHVHLLLDASGSMDGWEDKVIKAANEYIKQLSFMASPPTITVTKFSDGSTDMIKGVPVYQVPQITDNDYWAGGGTNMHGSVLRAIKSLRQEKVARKAIIILTDGEDGSMTPAERVKAQLEKCIAAGWLVIVLGADFDPTEGAVAMGVPEKNVIVFRMSQVGQIMQKMAERTFAFAAS